MPRTVARRFQSRAPRRQRVWARSFSIGQGVTDPALPIIVDLFSQYRALGGNTQGATVGRVRGEVDTIRSAGAGTHPLMFVGLIVAPSSVDAVDIQPSTNPALDWMLWTIQTPGSVAFGDRLTLDIRGMRKLDELGQLLWLVLEPKDVVDDFNVEWSISTLLLLP